MKPFRITIKAGTLLVGNHQLGDKPSTDSFTKLFGAPDRIETIHSDQKPWRNVLIYDSIGLSALEDLPDQSIVVVRFILIPDGTPRSPKNGLQDPLDLNGVTLKAGMTNDELPLRGELNFVKGIGSSWKFNHDQCFVSIEMRRLKRADGKAVGLPVLFELTYSFK